MSIVSKKKTNLVKEVKKKHGILLHDNIRDS